MGERLQNSLRRTQLAFKKTGKERAMNKSAIEFQGLRAALLQASVADGARGIARPLAALTGSACPPKAVRL